MVVFSEAITNGQYMDVEGILTFQTREHTRLSTVPSPA